MSEVTAFDSFLQLDARQQRAVELKYLATPHADIVETLKSEFNKPLGIESVNHWFGDKGKLQEALNGYTEHMAVEALVEAKSLVRVYAPEALKNLRELSKAPFPGHVRVAASRVLAQTLIKQADFEIPKPKSITQKAIDQDLEDIMREFGMHGDERVAPV